jgi:hypothetical protein
MAVATAVAVGLFIGNGSGRPQVADDVAPSSAEDEVTESEVKLYIDVYAAMQRDHDLGIEAALVPYKVTLPEFRSIERRIQTREVLVKRVRDALVDQAKAHAASMAFPGVMGEGEGEGS